jgi:hypothetical protein
MAEGTIVNRERAKQLIKFDGLMYGTKSLSDIDGVLDLGGRAFAFIEVKYKGTPLSVGQRILLENLVDNMSRPTVSIFATHTVGAPEEDVIMAECEVAMYYWQGDWVTPEHTLTVGEVLSGFVLKFNRGT